LKINLLQGRFTNVLPKVQNSTVSGGTLPYNRDLTRV